MHKYVHPEAVEFSRAIRKTKCPIALVATWFGVSRQTIFNWLSGYREIPDHVATQMKQICRCLDAAYAAGKLPVSRSQQILNVLEEYEFTLRDTTKG